MDRCPQAELSVVLLSWPALGVVWVVGLWCCLVSFVVRDFGPRSPSGARGPLSGSAGCPWVGLPFVE